MANNRTAPLVNPETSLWAWLAYDLRRYRINAGLTLPAMGRIMGRSGSSLSNCEGGRRRITEKEAALLDKRFNTGGHFVRLLRFAQRMHDPDWFRQHVEYEARATIQRIYDALTVPGLFQTEEYARALISNSREPDVESYVQARMARQTILDRQPAPILWALLDENLLHRPVGGPKVMREQLAHLLELAERPNVTVRVVPWSTGAHQGLDGSFKILTTDIGEFAYTEACGGGRLTPDAEEVSRFARRFDDIGADALSRDSSRKLITQIMEAIK